MTLLLLQGGPGRAGAGGGVAPPPETDADLANVVLLLGFNGADAATDGPGMTDESLALHGEAFVIGGAEIDAAQSVFGGSSLFLDGSGEITFPDSADFDLGSGDFTIECWIRPTTISGGHDIIGQWEDLSSNLGWILGQNGAGLQLNVSTSGLDDIAVMATGSVLTANTWHAIAVDFDGTKYRLYVNGAMAASSTTLRTIFNSSYDLSIGGTVSAPFEGWIDELRITRTVARYASDSGYTVASSPYPRPAAPVNTALPVISGTTTVGQTLTTTSGTWSGSPTPTYAWQWKRGGTNISGATANTYLLVTADIGATMTAEVTATNVVGSAGATSAGVGPVSSGVTYATFDGTPLGAVTVTNGGLTATHNNTVNNVGVRSTTLKSSGKFYFEMTKVAGSVVGHIGLLLSTGTHPEMAGGTNCVMVSLSSGAISSNNVGTGMTVAAGANGNVYGFAIDLTARLGWIRKNNGNWNGNATYNPATGVGGFTIATGAFSPVVNFVNTGSAADQVTGNFGASAFGGAAPSGFTAGWTV